MRRTFILGALASAATVVAFVAALTVATTVRAGGGCHQPLTDLRGASVDLKQACMSPTVLRVAAGETVTFTNRDEMVHTVTGAGQGSGESWGSYDELAHGATFVHTFDEDGVYPYFCVLHPSMVGAVVVGDGGGGNPAAASGVTPGIKGASGSDRGSVVATSAGGAAGALVLGVAAYFAVATVRRRHGVRG